MKIIARRAFHFVDGELGKDKNGETMRQIKNQIIVKPSPYPQEVPDFIQNDELFQIAQRQGNLKVIP